MQYFKNTILILVIIIIIGAFFRFYKLDWGDGLFTHPDEYHIVASANQLSFPNQMHPHFFSYGTVTIYLIYFTQTFLELINTILNSPFFIHNSFLIGRFYSALFSTLTIILIYKITGTFLEKKWALLASFLVSLTPGLIQQAHFATPESNLTFSLFGSLLFLIYFTKEKKLYQILIASMFFGLALGVKISSLFFAPTFLLAYLSVLPSFKKLFTVIILSIVTALLTLTAAAPFVFLDFQGFRGTTEYEGSLATGELAVFYTRQFINTVPVLFQLEKILPYALGPALLALGLMGFCLTIYYAIKKPSLPLFLILTSFFTLFLPNAFLFTKWTRFIAPTFPFFAIFAAFLFSKLYSLNISKSFFLILNSLFLILTLFWVMAFFSIYQNPDIRITASRWLKDNTPQGSVFLVEGGNMVDLPLEGNFQRISLDFYNLEENHLSRQNIVYALERSDYFLIQSRRVFANHQKNPHLFPKTANFYDNLFGGKAGFTQIKQFSSYPRLEIGNWNLEFPDEIGEETWSVFDHPVIRVFKKTRQLSVEEYNKLLKE